MGCFEWTQSEQENLLGAIIFTSESGFRFTKAGGQEYTPTYLFPVFF